MKKELLEIIACPICKGDLELQSSEEGDEEIITGKLYCPKCSKYYSIEDGIPNLLPPGMDSSVT
jgi:uncharacterized protein YbaR (Trm112 family)|tara:strand:+ start:1799 stop:1990 length:192 start_codon:yes stop_codon:yes gene_type:complete